MAATYTPPAAHTAGRDLREHVARLEAAGQLARVSQEVALNQEIGALCLLSLRENGPALLFERPGGSSIPLVVDVLGSRLRYAMALGVEPDDLAREWNRRLEKLVPPEIVDSGPCQEHVLLGDDVDLTKLPAPIWNTLDGGPYLTLSCHISKDPVTGARNVGCYRNQVHDRKTLGILAAPYTHLGLHRAKAGNEPFPVALALGPEPAVVMTATSPVPFGTDELAVAGALQGEPIKLVRCLTVPLEAPAAAEFVIEGFIHPDRVVEEGPFGEFTGYYGGPRAARPVIEVTAITHRESPMLHATYEGRPPNESSVLTGVPREAELLRQVKLPGIKKVHVTGAAGGALHAIVAVEKLYEGFGKSVGMAVLGTHPGRFIKQVIVVDDDVDPFDATAVEWAIATRVQPHRDVEVFKEVTGIILDPSLARAEQHTHARTSKWIIDATKYDAKHYPELCEPDATAMERMRRLWQQLQK